MAKGSAGAAFGATSRAANRAAGGGRRGGVAIRKPGGRATQVVRGFKIPGAKVKGGGKIAPSFGRLTGGAKGAGTKRTAIKGNIPKSEGGAGRRGTKAARAAAGRATQAAMKAGQTRRSNRRGRR